MAKDAATQFVRSILGNPSPAPGLQAEDALDCTVYLRVFLEVTGANRIHEFGMTFLDPPQWKFIRHEGEVLNQRAVGTVFKFPARFTDNVLQAGLFDKFLRFYGHH